MNICLDTMILIWGIQFYRSPQEIEQRASSEQRREFLRAAATGLGTWLSELQNEEDVVFTIPAPALMEYLTWFKDYDTRQEELERIRQWATIPALGTPAADRAADLFRRFRNRHGWKIKGSERPQVKVDAMIAAIADLAGADFILTDNEADFQHYAQDVRPEIVSLATLPEPEQSSLVLRLGLHEFLQDFDES